MTTRCVRGVHINQGPSRSWMHRSQIKIPKYHEDGPKQDKTAEWTVSRIDSYWLSTDFQFLFSSEYLGHSCWCEMNQYSIYLKSVFQSTVLGVSGRNGVLVQKHVVKETKQENENVIILLHYLEERVVMEMLLKLRCAKMLIVRVIWDIYHQGDPKLAPPLGRRSGMTWSYLTIQLI